MQRHLSSLNDVAVQWFGAHEGPCYGKQRPTGKQLRVMILTMGLFVLVMLVMCPVWSAAVLMNDPVYTYFNGSEMPRRVIISSFSVIVLHLVMWPCFFRLAKPQSHHLEMVVTGVGLAFVALVGVLFISVGYPELLRGVQEHGAAGYCQYVTSDTFSLFSTSQRLQHLRADDACKRLNSVEECTNFPGKSKETEIMRYMEENLRCSGYCYTNLDTTSQHVWAAANARAIAAYPDKKQMPLPDYAHPTQPAYEAADAVVNYTARPKRIFPSTLFSKSNWEVSCDGQAYRHVQAHHMTLASMLHTAGFALCSAAAVLGLLVLSSMCTSWNGNPRHTY